MPVSIYATTPIAEAADPRLRWSIRRPGFSRSTATRRAPMRRLRPLVGPPGVQSRRLTARSQRLPVRAAWRWRRGTSGISRIWGLTSSIHGRTYDRNDGEFLVARSTCCSRTPGGPQPIGGSVLFEHALTACADYTLCDRAGRLMAVIEAKRARTPWLASLSALRARCHV